MDELMKTTNVFHKMSSNDYLNKARVNLPELKISKQETGRELNMIGLKCSKTPTKKSLLSTTPKKSNTLNKTSAGSDRKNPYFQKRMNLKLQVTPQVSPFDTEFSNGNYKKLVDGENYPSLNCAYQVKDQNNTNFDVSEFIKEKNESNSLNDYNSRKNGPNIALNLNLALNMDSKEKAELSKSEKFNTSEKNNSIMDTPSAIKVAVRMRPLSENEKAIQGDSIKDVLIKDNRVLIPHKKECFEFDYCLNSSNPELFDYASQETVYRNMGEPLLDMAFQGYNVCLFAYGQSGSGKTFTMMGNERVPGIIPRFINSLFKKISLEKDIEFIVNINFLEIYNEKIYDLLSDEFSSYNKNLRVREHPQTGPYVEDLTVYTVENYENAMELLQNGISRRSTASIQSNEQSSRSHSIFNIILVQNKKIDNIDYNNSDSETSCISKINLVDLAGSERVNSPNIDRFREGTMINKSLLTLGKVISQLADNNGHVKNAHIPYRESVLTYLLKDSLGGNSRTSMIATISPAKAHLDETVSTLRYASTAQKIINIVHVNEDPKIKIINSLLKQISFLKKEVDKSKEQSIDNSDYEINEISTKQREACSENVMKSIKKLKHKFNDLLQNQQKILEDISNFKPELTSEKEKFEIVAYESNIIDELNKILKSVKETKVIDNSVDYISMMDDISSKATIKEDNSTKGRNNSTENKKYSKDDSDDEKEFIKAKDKRKATSSDKKQDKSKNDDDQDERNKENDTNNDSLNDFEDAKERLDEGDKDDDGDKDDFTSLGKSSKTNIFEKQESEENVKDNNNSEFKTNTKLTKKQRRALKKKG